MSKVKSELVKKLKNLMVELEKIEPREGNTIEVVDLYMPYNHLFNPAAKQAMKFQKKKLMNTRKVGSLQVVDVVHYFSATALGEEALYRAAKKVAKDINVLADKGFISGFLVNLSTLKLHFEDFELPHMAVFSYPAITPEGQEWLQSNGAAMALETMTEEGEVGPLVK